MSDLAENFGQQQADNVLDNVPVTSDGGVEARTVNTPGNLPPVITRQAAPITSGVTMGTPMGYQQLVDTNKANYSLMNRNEITPNMGRSLKELEDRQSSIQYLSAFSGMEASYVAQNWDNLVKRMYPNTAPNATKITENFRAIKNNAQLLLDLNSWYEKQMMGDTSQRTQEEIAARERNLMPMDEYIRMMPEGSLKRFFEESAYKIVEQYPQMKQTVGANLKGAIIGGTTAAATVALAAMTGGVSLVASAGAAVGATGALGSGLGVTAQAAAAATIMAGAKVGGTVNTFDTLNRQLRGATYRSMIARMKEEGIDVSPRHIAQMSKIIGGIGAGLNTIEFGLLAKFFGGTKAITKAFYETAGTEKFLGQLAKSFGQRILANGGTILSENLLEITEEVVDYVGQELFFKLQGVDSTFDMTQEEFTDALKSITWSTTANTMAYGVGFGMAGATVDASLNHAARRTAGQAPLSGQAQAAVKAMPDMKDAGFKIDEVTGGLDVSEVSTEVIESAGEQLNDMIISTPEIEGYMSPAQKIIRDEYIRRNPTAMRLNEALSFVTGSTMAELEGMSTFTLETVDGKQARFSERLAQVSPDLTVDGTVTEIVTPDGRALGVAMTVEGSNVTIEYESFEGTGESGTVQAELTDTGGLRLLSSDGNVDLGALVFDTIAPGETLFDRNIEIPNEYVEAYNAILAYSIKPHDEITLQETKDIQQTIQDVQQRLYDMKPATEGEVYTKEVPTIKDFEETYWEDEEYTEMVEEFVEPEEMPDLVEVEPEVEVAVEPSVDTDALPRPTSVPEKLGRILERFDLIYGENPAPEMAAKVAKSKARLLLAAKSLQESTEAAAQVTEVDATFLAEIRESLLDTDADYKKVKDNEAALNKTQRFTEEGNPVPAFYDIDAYRPWDILEDLGASGQRIPISAIRATIAKYIDGVHKQVEPWSTLELDNEIDAIAESLYEILPEVGEDDADGLSRERTIVDDRTIPSEFDVIANELGVEAMQVSLALEFAQEKAAGARMADGFKPKLKSSTLKDIDPEAFAKNNTLKRNVRDRYIETYNLINSRLTERMKENSDALYTLEPIPHNLEKFYSAIEVMQSRLAAVNGLDAVKAPVLDEYSKTIRNLNASFLAYYDKIVGSLKEVYESHKESKLATDMKEGDRRAALMEEYRSLLNIEAQEYFRGREIDTAGVAGIFDDRKALYEQNQKLLLFADDTMPSYISPEQVAVGDIDPASVAVAPKEAIAAEVQAEPRLVEKSGVRKVKKTRTVQKTIMEAREFTRNVEGATNAVANQLEKVISDAKTIANKADPHINEMASVIQAIGGMVRSPKIRKFLDDLALEKGISYANRDTNFTLDVVEGMTPDEMETALQNQLGKLIDLPMAEISELYKQVLAAGKTDVRLTAYKVGDVEIPFFAMARQIIGEIKANDSIDNTDFLDGSKRKRAIAVELAMNLYNSTLNYDLLIEKFNGKESLVYKVLYADIKAASNGKRRFQFEHSKKYQEKFINLPGEEDAGKFYEEVMIDFEKFKFTKEMLLTLLQHKRNEYNWTAIKENGLSISGAFKGIRMLPDTQSAIMAFIEFYQPSEADMHVLDTFQEGMDELYVLANERHIDLYGSQLPRSEFYIHLRPDNSFDESYRPMSYRSVEDVRLVFDTPNVYDRKGTKKPIRLTRIGDEFVSSTEAISDFYFMEKSMTRSETLVNTPQFKNAVVSRYGRDYLSFINSGLSRWAGERLSKGAFDMLLDKTRQLRGKAVLTLNPEVAFKQILSLPMFGIYVDAKYLTNAAMDMALSKEKRAEIDTMLKAWSTNYLTRGEGAGSWEIADTMRTREGKTLTRGSKNFEKAQWAFIRTADKAAVMTGMWAAVEQFNAEVERGYFSPTVKDALDIDDTIIPKLSSDQKMQMSAKFADYVLERTQPMHSPEHASHFQRASAISRSLSAFGSFTNQVNNVTARTYMALRRGDPGAVRSFSMALGMAAFSVPALTGLFDAGRRMAWDAMRGKLDEEDSYWKFFGEAYIMNIAGYWFGVRDIAKIIQQKIKYGPGAQTGVEQPLFELLELYVVAAQQFCTWLNPTKSDETRDNAWRNMLINTGKAAAYSSGFPYYPLKYLTLAIERGKE